MVNQYIKFLAEESKRNKLVIFVGAGVSMNSNLPSWSGLIDEFSDYLEIDVKGDYTQEEILSIPQIFYDKFGKIKYYEILNKTFGKNFAPNEIHDCLKKVSPQYIITTNYDSLIEKKLNKPKKVYDVISREEDLAHSQLNEMIIKMHGDLSNKNVVLKKDDYDNYEEDFPLITTFIKSLFTTNTILFLGYSLNDVNVKLIMGWIKDILKEDFRRVYLADLSENNIRNKYLDKTNKLINRIFIREFECNRNYLDDLSKDEAEDKGTLLVNFLKSLIKNREKLDLELSGNLYKELKYIPDSEIKKIVRENNQSIYLRFVSYLDSDVSPFLEKEVTIDSFKDDKIMYNFNIGLLLKSNISIVNSREVTSFEEVHLEKNNLEKNHTLMKKAFELLITYDFNKLNKMIERKSIENELFISYCYYKQNRFNEAINVLNSYVEKTTNPELVLWGLFNLNLIIWKKGILIGLSKEENEINLKEEYFNYFDNMHNDLYDEIFNNSLLKSYNSSLIKILFEIKKKKNSSIGGFSQIEQARIKISEFLNHVFLNGHIMDALSETSTIFRNYIDIALYAYKNDIKGSSSFDYGKTNTLSSFNYVDIFAMLQVDYKELSTLFTEYNIKDLSISNENKDVLIKSFINFIKFFLSCGSNIKRHQQKSIDKYLLILSKVNFNQIHINKILDALSKEKIIQHYSSDSYSLVNSLMNKNLDKVKIKSIELFIKNFLVVSNQSFHINKQNYVFGVLSYIYNEKNGEKLNLESELEEAGFLDITRDEVYIKENKLKIILYLSIIFVENLKERIKKVAENYLKKGFSVEIYGLMLRLDLIKSNKNYEAKIINLIDRKFYNQKHTSYPDGREVLVREIIILNLEGYSSENFINSLKEISNEFFYKYLEKNNYYNIYKYSLSLGDFDFSSFKIEDLDMFTEKGLTNLLKEDTNGELKETLKKYLINKYEDKYLNALLEV